MKRKFKFYRIDNVDLSINPMIGLILRRSDDFSGLPIFKGWCVSFFFWKKALSFKIGFEYTFK